MLDLPVTSKQFFLDVHQGSSLIVSVVVQKETNTNNNAIRYLTIALSLRASLDIPVTSKQFFLDVHQGSSLIVLVVAPKETNTNNNAILYLTIALSLRASSTFEVTSSQRLSKSSNCF